MQHTWRAISGRTSPAVFSSLLGGAVAFSRYATIPAAHRSTCMHHASRSSGAPPRRSSAPCWGAPSPSPGTPRSRPRRAARRSPRAPPPCRPGRSAGVAGASSQIRQHSRGRHCHFSIWIFSNLDITRIRASRAQVEAVLTLIEAHGITVKPHMQLGKPACHQLQKSRHQVQSRPNSHAP